MFHLTLVCPLPHLATRNPCNPQTYQGVLTPTSPVSPLPSPSLQPQVGSIGARPNDLAMLGDIVMWVVGGGWWWLSGDISLLL